MPETDPPFNHDKFFRRGDYEEYVADQMRERPNTELKVRFRPNQSTIPTELKTELLNDHNMELSRSSSDNSIVIVSGTLPDDGFGEQQIMEVVKRYAPNAEVVPQHGGRGG